MSSGLHKNSLLTEPSPSCSVQETSEIWLEDSLFFCGNIRVIGELNLVSVFYYSLLEEEEKKKDDKTEKVDAGKAKKEAVQVSASGHQATHTVVSLQGQPQHP
jgi:hypothetical protein